MNILRSMLFAPGNNSRRVDKALGIGADAIILDLEDAVPVNEKIETRECVAAALQRPRTGRGYVRINALSSEWSLGDLLAVVHSQVDGIVLPKVEAGSDVLAAEWVLGQLEHERRIPHPLDLVPIIETAVGLERISEIAHAGRRVRRLAFGAGDYTLDAGVEWTRDETELLPARFAIVNASRAANLDPPLDTVWTDLADKEGFAESAKRARRHGFQGKFCIHPSMLGIVHEVFSPTSAEIAWSERVVAGFEEAERSGSASIQIDGQFVDYPIVAKARGVLELAGQLAAQRARGRDDGHDS